MTFQTYLWAVLMAAAPRIPVMAGTAALFWVTARRCGWLRQQAAFHPHDLLTWPLRFAVAEGALLGLLSALFLPLLADTPSGHALAAGLGTALALGAASVMPAPRRA